MKQMPKWFLANIDYKNLHYQSIQEIDTVFVLILNWM